MVFGSFVRYTARSSTAGDRSKCWKNREYKAAVRRRVGELGSSREGRPDVMTFRSDPWTDITPPLWTDIRHHEAASMSANPFQCLPICAGGLKRQGTDVTPTKMCRSTHGKLLGSAILTCKEANDPEVFLGTLLDRVVHHMVLGELGVWDVLNGIRRLPEKGPPASKPHRESSFIHLPTRDKICMGYFADAVRNPED